MRSNKALATRSQPLAQNTNSADPQSEPYGDIYRLDAYPWMTDREDYEEGTLRKTLQEHRDTFDGPRGLVRRHWGVVGFEDTGLPRRSEIDLYLALLLKTLAAGPGVNAIRISYRELAPCLGLEPEPPSYPRVGQALNRLMGVTVRFEGQTAPSAENGTNEERTGLFASFGILESATKIVDGDETLGVIKWNENVMASVRSLAQARSVSFLNEQSGTDDAEALSRTSLLRLLHAPDARAIAAPE